MAYKRLRQQDTESETETAVDSRLSDMPESLQLCILSFLDAKHAVATSLLSNSWVSSWTCLPVLNFNSDSFQQLHAFDDFVLNVLSRRQPVKLDRLTFKRGGTCDAETFKKIFDYAFSHGVQELEVNITHYQRDWIWPITSSHSLTSLKLKSSYYARCSFLEPRPSGLFNNLTNLHLTWVLITDLDPFSRFPALDKLTLVSCFIDTNDEALNVHALQLSEFTFFNYNPWVGPCEFTTPKLRYFQWRGSCLPRLKAHLPVLDTAIISYHSCYGKIEEKIMFDNLLTMFDALHAAKSLTVSAHVVRLLTWFAVNGCSPFRYLKSLKLDFGLHLIDTPSQLDLSETLKHVPSAKAYLSHKSRHAKCTIINGPKGESTCSSSQKTMCDMTPRQAGQQVARTRPKRMVKKPARFLD